MAHKSQFSNGGYVVHAIRIDASPMKFSVWCDKDGNATDIEAIDARNVSRPCPKSYRKQLAMIASGYLNA